MKTNRPALFSTLKELRLLLVEDDELIRDSLCLFFENEGCRLDALETAEQGLESVKNNSYDIIITDFRLPDIDGLDFLRQVHRSQPLIKKILLTAYMDEEVLSEALRAGVQECIEKPFSTADLEKALAHLLAKPFVE